MSRGSPYKAVGDGANPTLATIVALLTTLNVTLSIKPRAPAEDLPALGRRGKS